MTKTVLRRACSSNRSRLSSRLFSVFSRKAVMTPAVVTFSLNRLTRYLTAGGQLSRRCRRTGCDTTSLPRLIIEREPEQHMSSTIMILTHESISILAICTVHWAKPRRKRPADCVDSVELSRFTRFHRQVPSGRGQGLSCRFECPSVTSCFWEKLMLAKMRRIVAVRESRRPRYRCGRIFFEGIRKQLCPEKVPRCWAPSTEWHCVCLVFICAGHRLQRAIQPSTTCCSGINGFVGHSKKNRGRSRASSVPDCKTHLLSLRLNRKTQQVGVRGWSSTIWAPINVVLHDPARKLVYQLWTSHACNQAEWSRTWRVTRTEAVTGNLWNVDVSVLSSLGNFCFQ